MPDDKHTVKITFRRTLSEHETPESFVSSCLTGNRSNAFARSVNVWVVDNE